MSATDTAERNPAAENAELRARLAEAEARLRARSRAAGFAEHLVKPIEVPKLIAAIRRVTESRGGS